MNIKKVLDEERKKLEIDKESYEKMEKLAEEVVSRLKKEISKKKIKAEVFIGGSFAKGTLIKKDKYDVDIYVKFTSEEETKKLEKIVGNAERVHGSRDYFRMFNKNIMFEIIPTVKVKNPKDANNVTDLSFFHVNYIKNKIKQNPKLRDEIKLGKVFTFCQGVYGAESYIKGFSGYALELLIVYYKSFEKFISEIVKAKDKIVVDMEKFYKNKQEVLNNLNEAKMSSPIIFVDPTFKERNALAALSPETFEKFREICRRFLNKPSLDYFEKKEFDLSKFKKAKGEFFKLLVKTDKQAGDIAGSKMLKFSKYISSNIEKYFEIKNSEFIYSDAQESEIYFILNKKKEIILSGPPINNVENLLKFKKAHNDVFIKENRAFAREKIKFGFKDFFKSFKDKNKKVIESMGMTKVEII